MKPSDVLARQGAQTSNFGGVGRGTGDKISQSDCAAMCYGLSPAIWDAVRLHWTGDASGMERLLLSGIKYAHRANEQEKYNRTGKQLARLTAIALMEFKSPRVIWIKDWDSFNSEAHGYAAFKWTHDMRSMLFGVKQRQWFKTYAKIYEDIHKFYQQSVDEAADKINRNQR